LVVLVGLVVLLVVHWAGVAVPRGIKGRILRLALSPNILVILLRTGEGVEIGVVVVVVVVVVVGYTILVKLAIRWQ
jgi:hypothetical protein